MSKNIKINDRIAAHLKYGGRCAYCGIDIAYEKMQVDHIVPIYRGYSNEELSAMGIVRGKNHISNYNPSCRSCNSSKSTYRLESWRIAIRNKINILTRDNSGFRMMLRYNVIKVSNKDIQFYYETL